MPKISLLTDFCCIEARGRDAAAFLHAQLATAIRPTETQRAPLAGWLDARGRVRALLRVWPAEDRFLLATPRDGVMDVIKRLKMFVLRSAVALHLADDVELAGVIDATADWRATTGLPGDTPAGGLVAREGVRWLHVGGGYWQALGPRGAIEALAPELERAPTTAAALAEIARGLPVITPPLVDRYVAQVLNLDALGAVAFDKGCYPGQEIVARVHNLGDVKRRVRRYSTPSLPPAVGSIVTAAGGEPAGEVVRSSPAETGSELLAVVDHAAAEGPLAVGGAPLRGLPLPFVVPRA